MGWLYMLLFPNGKVYIGQTVRPLAVRWKQHQKAALDVAGHHAVLYHGWRKHGTPRFVPLWEVPRDELDEAERRLIVTFDCLYPHGYNTTAGGDANPMSTAVGREAVARSKRGVKRGPRTPEWTANHAAAMRAVPRTPEWRARISAALKGKKKSPAHVEKMAANAAAQPRKGSRWRKL